MNEYFEAVERKLEYIRHFDQRQWEHQRTDLPPDDELPGGNRAVFSMMRHAVVAGEPYYWAPMLCGLVESLALTVPDHWQMHRTRLPSRTGFFSFANPILTDDAVIDACAWYADDAAPANMVVATLYMTEVGRNPNCPVHQGVRTWLWEEGKPLSVYVDAESATNCPTDDPIPRSTARALAAMFALLEQQIFVTSRERIPRPTRRRAKAAGHEVEFVRVVRLREVRHTKDARGDHTIDVEWTCRWIVSGHWRDQWYPSLGCHQPIYILPYVKGPDDLPLKPQTQRLFAVIR
jgi:hypothetical protein